jgi:hypothetical protein
MSDQPLSRTWTSEEIAAETRGIDERLPEASTVNRGNEPPAHTAGSVEDPGHEAAVDQLNEGSRRPAEPQPSASDSYERD